MCVIEWKERVSWWKVAHGAAFDRLCQLSLCSRADWRCVTWRCRIRDRRRRWKSAGRTKFPMSNKPRHVSHHSNRLLMKWWRRMRKLPTCSHASRWESDSFCPIQQFLRHSYRLFRWKPLQFSSSFCLSLSHLVSASIKENSLSLSLLLPLSSLY